MFCERLKRLFHRPEPDRGAVLHTYLKSYRERLDIPVEIDIADISRKHRIINSSLHRLADSRFPDVSAFLYAAMRLPYHIDHIKEIITGTSVAVFARFGYPGIEKWQRVQAISRRKCRLYRHDGQHRLAVFLTSLTDLDDLIPSLCTFQIEWNKVHDLLMASRTGQALAQGSIGLSGNDSELRHILHLNSTDWMILHRFWGNEWEGRLRMMAQRPVSFTVWRLPLDEGYFDSSAGSWWEEVIEHLRIDLSGNRPIYLISSNNHSIANTLTGYARANEDNILAFIRQYNPEGLWDKWLDARRDPDQNATDLLYYGLRLYLEQFPDAHEDMTSWERAAGLTRYTPENYLGIETQKIELKRLMPKNIDPRLKMPDGVTSSPAIILNINYSLGLTARHLITQALRFLPGIKGIFILGKSAATIGRLGDIMLPDHVYDSHTDKTYHFKNAISIRQLTAYLNTIAAFDTQKSITVKGTFLHGKELIGSLIQDDFTGIEMEAGPFIGSLHRFFGSSRETDADIDIRLPQGFSFGLLHYTSDTPYNMQPSLLSSRLGQSGLEAAYASSLAILQTIFDLEKPSG